MLVIFSSSTYFILVVAVAADVVSVVVVLFALSSMPSIFSAIFTPKLLRFRFFFSLASSPSPRLLQVGETSRRDGTVWALVLVLVRVWDGVLAWARTGSADSAMCRVRACVPSVRACPRRGRVSLSLSLSVYVSMLVAP